jgi:hypothetical protein
MKKQKNKVIVTERNLKSCHLPQKGPGTKTNWPTDRRSQDDSNSKSRNVHKVASDFGKSKLIRVHNQGCG